MTRDLARKIGAVAVALLLGLMMMMMAGAARAQGPADGSQRLPRAYQGAPPLVPHEVEERKALCQECHTTGEQGAPITPHPTRTHFCIQCHVGQNLAVEAFEKTRGK